VKHPGNVKVLILCENKTSLKEFYFIKTYLNLIKVDLSYNKLNSFPQGFSFGGFQHLKTVFLHYNKFSALKNLGPVAEVSSVLFLGEIDHLSHIVRQSSRRSQGETFICELNPSFDADGRQNSKNLRTIKPSFDGRKRDKSSPFPSAGRNERRRKYIKPFAECGP
jgi:hypothetical protein